MRDDRFRPVDIADAEARVSLINEPLRDVVELRPGPRGRSLQAMLAVTLADSRALLRRLEDGVTVPPGKGRELIRQLYESTRTQLKILSACLELPDLE